MRFVTIAGPSAAPRADVTRTRSPLRMPFSFASGSGISTKKLDCKSELVLTCLVQ